MSTDEVARTGPELKTRREQAGLSRAALAGRAGCSPGYIQQLEDGYTPRSGVKLDAILAALSEAEEAIA